MKLTVLSFCPEGIIPYFYMNLRIGTKVNMKKETTGHSWNPAPLDKSVESHFNE
jgi:hypothetical protein